MPSVSETDKEMVAKIEGAVETIAKIRLMIGRVIFGQEQVIDETLITLLTGGHALLIGVPCLAKTRLIETLGTVMGLADGMPDIRRVKPSQISQGRRWLDLRSNGNYTVSGVEQMPLLPGIAVLLLFLGLTMLAWQTEGQ